MDSLITAAAHALATGDPLGALKRVALRDDAPALALRGIAMAQLGDLVRAKTLLRRAGRAFGPKESVARARCVVAEAEIALASRDLGFPEKALAQARTILALHGDQPNAAHASYIEVRRLLLIGRLDKAERTLDKLNPTTLPPASQTIYELVVAGIALRRLRSKTARAALARAKVAARRAGIPALTAEVESATLALDAPAARLITNVDDRLLRLDEIESLFRSKAFIVDACRHLARAFGARRIDDSHRARLRVEIGRLRKMLRPLAGVSATKRGFKLEPHRARKVVVLDRPVDEEHAAVLALLADGESWSSSALALALGPSQRTVQRALESLAASGKVQSLGQGRARRWMTPPVPAFTTILLLPSPLPIE